MKKFALIAALSVVATGAALAQSPVKPPKSIKCAVMPEDSVDVAKATKDKMYADYKGRRYYFCCAGCPDAFKKNPTKYAKGPSVPLSKPKKK